MFGYSRDEAIGKNGRIFQGPETDRKSIMLIREVIRNERAMEISLLNYRKDGTSFWMLFQICPVFGKEDGRVIHFVGVQVPILRKPRRPGLGNRSGGMNLSEDGGGICRSMFRCCRREVCSESALELRYNSALGSLLNHDDRDMPPRRNILSNVENNAEGNQQPPPDAATRVLEGMAQLLAQHAGNSRGPTVGIYEQFRRMNPQDFAGTTDPFVAEDWIASLEVIFRYMAMADADRIRCAIFLLKGDARLWWEGAERGVNLGTLTWEDFRRIFFEKYFTADVRSRLTREFMSLRQGDLSVAEFVRKFDRGCHFVPLIANDTAMKLRHFLDGLRPTVRRDVLLSNPASYTDAVAGAYRAEQSLKDIEWKLQRKRPQPSQQHGQNKRPFTGQQGGHQGGQGQSRARVPQRQQGHQRQQPQKAIEGKPAEKPLCKECNRHHYGKCLYGTGKCFKCGGDHVVENCPKLRQPTTARAYVMHAEEVEPDTALITGTDVDGGADS